jgi:riboflavin kinase/FMN adenylyltransferase
MIIHEGYEGLNLVDPVVTLGIFDGVHKGHMALLGRLISRARELQGEAVVVTFSPHPRLVLDPGTISLTFLTTFEEKKRLLESAKVDHLVIIEFNREFSKIKACDFVKNILYGKIGSRHLLIGYDHRFGNRASGNFETLDQCAADLNFRVEKIQDFYGEDGPVSSSSIRNALLKGKIDEANRWLGYRYPLTGTVIEGRMIGHSIGFPTANIKPDSGYKLIPCDGVYAVEVLINGDNYRGMLSIGVNPTVSADKKRSIEVHILDFEGDIYGKEITVKFYKRLRDEIKFNSREDLSLQMMRDKQQVIQLLK